MQTMGEIVRCETTFSKQTRDQKSFAEAPEYMFPLLNHWPFRIRVVATFAHRGDDQDDMHVLAVGSVFMELIRAKARDGQGTKPTLQPLRLVGW